jgi:hypothetical protein
MRTRYLRKVPDQVVDRLERLASLAGTSLNALAVTELTESRRADNQALLGSLPDLNGPLAGIVRDLDAGRAER